MHVLPSGCGLHALHHSAAEFRVSLRGKTNAQWLRGHGAKAVSVDAGACTLDQAAVNQGAQQAEDGCFRKMRALDYIGETEFFVQRAKRFQHLAGAQDSLRLIAIATAVAGNRRRRGRAVRGSTAECCHRLTRSKVPRVYIPFSGICKQRMRNELAGRKLSQTYRSEE